MMHLLMVLWCCCNSYLFLTSLGVACIGALSASSTTSNRSGRWYIQVLLICYSCIFNSVTALQKDAQIGLSYSWVSLIWYFIVSVALSVSTKKRCAFLVLLSSWHKFGRAVQTFTFKGNVQQILAVFDYVYTKFHRIMSRPPQHLVLRWSLCSIWRKIPTWLDYLSVHWHNSKLTRYRLAVTDG